MQKPRDKHNLLILGATGMAGHKFLDYFSNFPEYSVRGTVRNADDLPEGFKKKIGNFLDGRIDANDLKGVEKYLEKTMPDVVINCVGLIKQLPIASQPLPSIAINSLFPHQLAHICKRIGSRMIHISTDCVFSGKKGNYSESDQSDAEDLYGKTKYLGEVAYPHCITLRTSIIGHELKGNYGLVEWFLRQKGKVKGFTKAIYTGFPTMELARIIREQVIPKTDLSGLYHVSANPISKYELLKIVASLYKKTIDIEPDDKFFCDRSLDSSRFRKATGYVAPPWETLVADMHEDYVKSGWYAEY
jgi:dTDP-4-dehydrorhamnose reductase